MKKEYVVSCETREQYNLLMEWAERNGYSWYGGLASHPDYYRETPGGWGISFDKRMRMGYSSTEWHRTMGTHYGPIIDFDVFMAEHGIVDGIIEMEF